MSDQLSIASVKPTLRHEIEQALAAQAGDKAEALKEKLALRDELEYAARQKAELCMLETRERFPSTVKRVRRIPGPANAWESLECDFLGTALSGNTPKLVLASRHGESFFVDPQDWEPCEGELVPIPFESEEERRLWKDLPRKLMTVRSCETLPEGERRLQRDIMLLEQAIYDGKRVLAGHCAKYEGLTGIKVERSF